MNELIRQSDPEEAIKSAEQANEEDKQFRGLICGALIAAVIWGAVLGLIYLWLGR